jgi:hypothetical protein
MNKEEVYDTQIFPLMAQIIAIAQEHKIAFVASFAIPTPDDDGLYVSTSLRDENNVYPGHLNAMEQILQRHIEGRSGGALMLTVTDKDGKKTMTTIVP